MAALAVSLHCAENGQNLQVRSARLEGRLFGLVA